MGENTHPVRNGSQQSADVSQHRAVSKQSVGKLLVTSANTNQGRERQERRGKRGWQTRKSAENNLEQRYITRTFAAALRTLTLSTTTHFTTWYDTCEVHPHHSLYFDSLAPLAVVWSCQKGDEERPAG